MLIREQTLPAHQPTATIAPVQPVQIESPILDEGPSFSSFELGISSAPSGSSAPQPAHDAASERLARFLSQESVNPAPKGKFISIGATSSNNEDSTVFKLKEEIGIMNQKLIEKDVLIGTLDVKVSELERENAQKSKQISEL